MNQISKELDQLIKNSHLVLPVKTQEGILVGDILIRSEGSLKDLLKNSKIVYKNVHLNVVAIKLANMLAKRQSLVSADKIYAADQEYGKWFVDSQMLRMQYQKAINNQDYDKADMLWARYVESRDRAITTKNRAQALCNI